MTGGFKFEPDKAGIARTLRAPGVAALLTSVAKLGRERIQFLAPNGFMDYRRSVRYVPAKLDGTELASAVGVDSPVWHLPEYGTARYPARAPIRRAMTDIGVDLKESG